METADLSEVILFIYSATQRQIREETRRHFRRDGATIVAP